MHVTALFDPNVENSDGAILKEDALKEIIGDYNELFDKDFIIPTWPAMKKDISSRLSHKSPYVGIATNRSQQLDLLIVVDQMLTGFDSKWINTVYLDKMQRSKNFIQTASRTNRLFGPEKKHGTIVWYRYPHTMTANFKAAVDEYSGNRPFGVFVDKLEKNLNSLNLIFDDICSHFEAVGIENFEQNYCDDGWKKKFAKLFHEFR